jgi:uncharacterized pyridoxamine 5'-phosphate oxidase family protein
MDFKDYMAFASQNPVAWVATAEGSKPRIKVLALWFADESGHIRSRRT